MNSFQMHAHMKLGKIKLKVSDLLRSLDFYQDVLGFQILHRDEHRAELTTDGINVLIELKEVQGAEILPQKSVVGLYHLAILLPTRQDLAMFLSRMVEKRIRVGHSDHWVSEALYIRDPDQNGIEIYRDRPRAEWPLDDNNRITMGGDPLNFEGLLLEAEGFKWEGLPTGTTIGHVHLHVGNLQTAKEFYCDLLGFELMLEPQDFKAIFISAGGYHHHIGLNIWAGEDAPQAPAHAVGLGYFTVVLPNLEEIGKLLPRLKSAGVPVVEVDDAWMCSDPFGNKIKLLAA